MKKANVNDIKVNTEEIKELNNLTDILDELKSGCKLSTIVEGGVEEITKIGHALGRFVPPYFKNVEPEIAVMEAGAIIILAAGAFYVIKKLNNGKLVINSIDNATNIPVNPAVEQA